MQQAELLYDTEEKHHFGKMNEIAARAFSQLPA
jgi:hypothetical protein